jgi:hypothetical protein
VVQSNAVSVQAYLAELEPTRRDVVSAVLDCLRASIQDGFEETMSWGMIAWEVPLSRYPDTYNKKPLLYCALAAQKRHYAVYLMNLYTGSKYLAELQTAYRAAGVKLDAGKCCIRFRHLDGILLPVVGRIAGACPVDEFIALYEAGRRNFRG